jgi:hypothetical protein
VNNMVSNIEFNPKEILVEELLNISKKMKSEHDLANKMFHFSAAFAICDRTIRLNYDRDLLLTSMVLQNSYNTILGRAQAASHGDPVIPIDVIDFDKLAEIVEELANDIKKDLPVYELLAQINEMTFKTTGPGYYMYINGKIP